MFVFAAAVILLCAERFAHALVATGRDVGISEFFLVQWLAPLASEAPELLIARPVRVAAEHERGPRDARLARRSTSGRCWSARCRSSSRSRAGGLHGLPIDGAAARELFLTAAQSFFAVAILSNLSISVREAWSPVRLVLGAVHRRRDRARVLARRPS